MAFYGYARFVDEIGDAYDGDRLAALNWLSAETAAALDGYPAEHRLVQDAVESVRELGADAQPLFDLVEANRMDQSESRYETFEDLVRYCQLSANPVGRLVLAAFGRSGQEAHQLSDSICTGLQIVEHCADMAEDYRNHRVYVPAEDWARFGVDPAELASGLPSSCAMRAMVAFEVSRACRFLDAGLPLIELLPGTLAWAVAGFWAGGRAAADRIAERNFDVSRPARQPSPTRIAFHLLGALPRTIRRRAQAL
jgi:squalene synthase HpnC